MLCQQCGSHLLLSRGKQGFTVGRIGRTAADPDADGLVQLLEQHWQALTKDAVVSISFLKSMGGWQATALKFARIVFQGFL